MRNSINFEFFVVVFYKKKSEEMNSGYRTREKFKYVFKNVHLRIMLVFNH